MPKRLPATALTVPPRLTAEQMSFSLSRRPLVEVQHEGTPIGPEPVIRRTQPPNQQPHRIEVSSSKEEHLEILLKMVTKVIHANMDFKNHMIALPEEAEHPASGPIYWISKWVDYSDKYGIGNSRIFIIFTRRRNLYQKLANH